MTQSNNEHLEPLPCPFCGGLNLDIRTYNVQPDDYHCGKVCCNDCETEGPDSLCLPDGGWMLDTESAKEEAVKAWNQRASTPLRELQQELGQVLHDLRANPQASASLAATRIEALLLLSRAPAKTQ